MISVDEAWRLLNATSPLGDTVLINLRDAAGRILAEPVIAKRSQPPRDMSAMDGYAVNFADIEAGLKSFSVIGEAPAGGLFEGALGSGQAVRIFTGGVVPDSANHIIIQEDVTRDNDTITLTATPASPSPSPSHWPSHIRKASSDFSDGDTLLPAGHRLSAADLALIANGNYAELLVMRRPRIAFIASGDELVPVGGEMSDTQIPDSNSAALAALVTGWGGHAVAGVLTPDDMDTFTHAVKALPAADIIVPIGGASVGDYDYAKAVFYDLGYESVFEKIAVKPGKPCWFAKGSHNLVLGLPGNPSSAMVTATLFLRPLIEKLSGYASPANCLANWINAVIAHELDANGPRENYLRGIWQVDDTGRVRVTVSNRQDSALTTTFAEANCLVQRLSHAPPLATGDAVKILPL